MKKLLLILLCLPMIFSCGEKKADEGSLNKEITKKENKDEESLSKKVTLEMLDDGYTGKGTVTAPNGDTYVGEWKYGMPNGQGTLTYANGDKYVGEYKDDKRNGQGTYALADGTVYKGLWENDKFLGE